jgi:hypothetical protein
MSACPGSLLDVGEADPGGDGDAVPLVGAEVHDLVPGRLEDVVRELLVPDLGLLEGRDVDLAARQPCADPVDPGADRVHVPGGETHEP